ncbi:DNA alkylation repair protein [Trinickia terrae]|uniref:DNA alkylation repair protein n=1 Tax=Trinickia terrae TaxID=2571161 RepID=A0A4V5PM02_9BURK|nr:DNA alkylation repair protein [Trinickia terrae]TKC86230.1 DNA alkylation repair protein [Trinickia terrae]
MSTASFNERVGAALMVLASPEKAVAMRAYMRDQFDYFGVPTPQRRAVLMPIFRELKGADASRLIELAEGLWALPQRECQYAAVDLLARYRKVLALEHLPALFALAQRKSWWDSVDGLAGIAGDVVRAERKRDPACQIHMDHALRHENMWVRRIAMLHQLGWRGETDVPRLFRHARELAPETDFFIRKAIGWALRDYAWHDPHAIRGFLDDARDVLSPLSLREAGKNLSRLP